MTSFEDSHYILLFRYIYDAQLTQWFCFSKHLHVNRNYRPNGNPLSAILLTSLSIFAQLPTLRWYIFLTKALPAFWVIPNWFSRFCSQNGYLSSKLPPPGLFLYPPQPGGGGGCRIRPLPRAISKTDGRREMDEAAFERSRRDASKSLFENLKLRSRVRSRSGQRSKSGVFRLQTVVTSNVAFFRPKLSICTPKDQAKVLTSEIVSYLAQVKVKVRSEKVTKPKIFKWVVWHMFYGPFWTKNLIVMVILQFHLIWTKKMRKSIQGQVK